MFLIAHCNFKTGNKKLKYSMKKNYSLSVIIITKNEEDRIETCLESVKDIADEIIIVDSGSTDKTLQIAEKYTDKITQTDWPGYGIQKQRALDKAQYEWVLSIDADEALSPELRKEINATLSGNPAETVFRLPWAVVIFGKRLYFGNSSRSVRRLFRRKGAKFTSAEVHEKIQIPNARVGRLKGKLFHYSVRDFEHYLYKNRTYSWLGAQKRFKENKHGGGLAGAAFRALWVFFVSYIIKGGFLDGKVGFLVSAMYSQGAFNKYAGLWTLHRMEKINKT